MKYKIKTLPRYWLGTRMPTSLGYQPNYGIGNVQFTNTPGQSLSPEIRTIKSNAIPGALNKLQQTSSLATTALGSIYGPQLAKTGAKSAAKIGANTLGAVMGGVGTVAGGIDMGFQIAGNKDYRHPGEMRNNLGTNTYTTDLGNTYTTKSGLDQSAERRYAEAERKRKNLEFTATSIGTGMSAGLLAGSLIGTSAAPGIGTAIGAGVGALGGLIAYGLGFGDTEEETKNAISNLENSLSMENRMSESSALDKDVKQGFYGRLDSGSIAKAAFGKPPYGKMSGNEHGKKRELLQGPDGYTYGKATSMGMPGEFMYDTKTYRGQEIKGKGDADTEPLNVEPGDSTAIYSKKLKLNGTSIADMARPYIEHQNKLHKIIENAKGSDEQRQFQTYMAKRAMDGNNSALLKLSQIQDMIRSNNETANYKCGKLPKYSGGTPWLDYVLTAAPNIAQTLAAIQQQNADKHMPIIAPTTTADYSSARNAAYRIAGRQPDMRPIYNDIDSAISQNIYSLRRMPGIGMGGRAALLDSAIKAGMKQKASAMYQAEVDKINRQNAADQLIATINQRQEDLRNQNFNNWATRYQYANAAKYNAEAQDRKNIVLPFAQGVKDALGLNKYYTSLDYGNRKLELIDKSLSANDQEYINGLQNGLSSGYFTPQKNFNDWFNNLSPEQKQYIYGEYARRANTSGGF